jgi:predicted Rossmann-fold nucleotide-binding protein
MSNDELSPQMDSPSYRLASLDQEFLLGESMRGVRFLLEFAKADEILRSAGVRSTLVVFGSARVREDGSRARSKLVCTGAAIWTHRLGARRRFERALVASRQCHRHRRRSRDNGSSQSRRRGLRRDFGRVQHHFAEGAAPKHVVDPRLSFRFHYFAMRKMHLAMRANALVVFPGGFGTMDELFELLTLRQTDKAPRIPIVLADRDYWQSIINFERLVDLGMVDRADLDLFGFAEDAESIWAELLTRGLKPHSSIELAAEQDTP